MSSSTQTGQHQSQLRRFWPVYYFSVFFLYIIVDPTLGLVSFTFSPAWNQSKNSLYVIRPRTGGLPIYWYTKNTTQSNGTCLFSFCTQSASCSQSGSLQVLYSKENCCTPGCSNGGTCQSDGTCSCSYPYSAPNCLCLPGYDEVNGTCIIPSTHYFFIGTKTIAECNDADYGACDNTCAAQYTYTGGFSIAAYLSTPQGLPSQIITPTGSGWATSMSLFLSRNTGTDPLHVELYTFPGQVLLSSSTNNTRNAFNVN